MQVEVGASYVLWLLACLWDLIESQDVVAHSINLPSTVSNPSILESGILKHTATLPPAAAPTR